MAEIKKHGSDEKEPNLKREDQRKSHGTTGAGSAHGIDLFGGRKITADKGIGPNVKVKKKLPLAVDIIAGILMLALVCGIIVGSYILFRYYSNDYATKSVTYTVMFEADEELNKYASMKNGELYMDVSGSAVYFGKITEVKTVESDEGYRVILKVSATVRYRRGEGYSIGESRLAVGAEYELRYVERILNVSVVELKESGGK